MPIQISNVINSNKAFAWLALGTAAILSIPLIAMQFTDEVVWGAEDFIAMSILLFGTGSLFVIVARLIPSQYRLLVAAGFIIALLTMWVHLAVGIVDTWPLAGS